jgi:uncharacterized lipoprotein YddW (UPF0748 family)
LLALWLTLALWQTPPIPQGTKEAPELRGVWLTNYGGALSYYTTRLDEVMAAIARHHLNTVYPAVWNRGNTLHPSQVMKQAGGHHRDPLTSLPLIPGQDALAGMVHQAHRQGLRVIPWFEYGLWVPTSAAIAQRHPNWFTTTQQGNRVVIPPSPRPSWMPRSVYNLCQEFAGANQAWLNPLHPEVQAFLESLLVEVVQSYDVDGIQLDDHFGLPIVFGYDPYTVNRYRQEHQGQSPPSDPADPDWVKWRATQLTQLMTRLVKAVRAARPNIVISLSPQPPGFAYRQYLQDWPDWVGRGLVDEVIVQLYREDWEPFLQELSSAKLKPLQSKTTLGIGLFTGPLRQPKPIERVQREVEAVRSAGYGGVSFFTWETTTWGNRLVKNRSVKQMFQLLFPKMATPLKSTEPRPEFQLTGVGVQQ